MCQCQVYIICITCNIKLEDIGGKKTNAFYFRYTTTPEDTVAAALKGGTDLNCGSFYQKNGQVV